MSNKKYLSNTFQIQKNTPEYIAFRIAEVRKHYEDKIKSIRKIDEKYFQLLCLFSLIDSLAQEYSNYSQGHEQKKFTTFVLKFQKKWDFLENIDPVTLYYDVQEQLDDEINLDLFARENVYTPAYMIKSGVANKIFDYLESKGFQCIDSYKKRHRYVNLLYKMRSKLSHELSTSGSVLRMGLGEVESLPYYLSVSRLYTINEKIIEDDIWELVVPVEFVEQLLRDCLNNYLVYCAETQRDPFLNNKFERKFRVAWYD